jgi:hypothetical protein
MQVLSHGAGGLEEGREAFGDRSRRVGFLQCSINCCNKRSLDIVLLEGHLRLAGKRPRCGTARLRHRHQRTSSLFLSTCCLFHGALALHFRKICRGKSILALGIRPSAFRLSQQPLLFGMSPL